MRHKRPPLHGLTGIRFVAALMVLLLHFGSGFAARSHFPGPIVTFLRNGFLGVSLFFILSGFIITYTYDGRLTSRSDFRNYAVARFSRLYPTYLLALLLMLPFAWPWLTPVRAAAVLAMVQSWTLPTSAFGFSWLGQAWTLSVELGFYLAAPLLLAALRPVRGVALAGIAALAAAAVVLLGSPNLPPGSTVFTFGWVALIPLPILRLAEFVFGATMCKLFMAYPEQLRRVGAAPLVTLNAVAIVALIATRDDLVGRAIAMVLVGLLIPQLAATETYLSRALGSRIMILLGSSSYALYLLQAPVRECLRLLLPSAIGQAVNLPVAVVASVIVFTWWEEPARRWIRVRLSKQRTGTPPVQRSVAA